jgi:hypothetical protein
MHIQKYILMNYWATIIEFEGNILAMDCKNKLKERKKLDQGQIQGD